MDRIKKVFICLAAFIAVLLLSPKNSYAWDNNGGDHSGADWTISVNTTVSGSHINIGNLTVQTGVQLSIQGNSTINVNNNVDLQGTAVVYVLGSATTGPSGGRGVIINTNNITIGASASINGTGKGYVNMAGPGYLVNTAAAYGGTGGNSNPNVYGSADAPSDLGSGAWGTYGGFGGGAIKINATGNAVINGTIVVDGNPSNNNHHGGAGGSIWIIADNLSGSGNLYARGGANGVTSAGGSGGRIAVWYNSSTFSNVPTAAISTKGGDVAGASNMDGSNGTVIYTLIGSKPAKYIATPLTATSQPVGIGATSSTNVLYLGAWGVSSISQGSENLRAEFEIKQVGTSFDGTSTIITSAQSYALTSVFLSTTTPSLANGAYHMRARIINSYSDEIRSWQNYPVGTTNPESAADFVIDTGSSYSNSGIYTDMTISDNFYLPMPSLGKNLYFNTLSSSANPTINSVGDLTIYSTTINIGGTTTWNVNGSNINSASGGRGLTINTTDFTLNSNSNINGSGLGYTQGHGPGYFWDGGAAHGGNGAFNSNTYGVAAAPIELGSGGNATQGSGGSGGSALKLNAVGTATISGNIYMNGNPGSGYGGGGAGGSIWVIASVLAGSGNLYARGGGTAGTTCCGGGGGRIALNYGSSSFSNVPTAAGNTTAGAGTNASGANGTISISDLSIVTNLNPALTIIDSNTSQNLSQLGNTAASVQAQIQNNGVILAGFTFNISADRNLGAVTGTSDTSNNKAIVLGLSSAPGVGLNFEFYVPKDSNDNKLTVCPSATSIGEVTSSCSGSIQYNTTSPEIRLANVGGRYYWVVKSFTSGGGISGIITHIVSGLPAGLTLLDASNTQNLSLVGTASTSVQGQLKSDGTILAGFTFNISVDRNLSGVSGISDTANNKSIVLGLSSAPGLGLNFEFYVPRSTGEDKLTVCPGATNISDVTTSCSGAIIYNTTSPEIRLATVNSRPFWVVKSFSGGGAMSGVLAYYVSGLPADINLYVASTTASVKVGGTGYNSAAAILNMKLPSGRRLADITANLQSDLNWSSVNVASSENNSLLLLGINSAPGVSVGSTAYVPKESFDDRVSFCPNAHSISDISSTCSGVTHLNASSANTSTITIGGTAYWKLTNFTSGGLISNVEPKTVAGVPSNLNIVVANSTQSVETGSTGIGSSSVELSLQTDGGNNLLNFTADLTQNRDWSSLTTSTSQNSVLVGGLGSSPGINLPATVFVPKLPYQDELTYCPDATRIIDVTRKCVGAIQLSTANADIINIGGSDYWSYDGFNGGGVISNIEPKNIAGLSTGLDIVTPDDFISAGTSGEGIGDSMAELLIITSETYPIALTHVDMTRDHDWTGVDGDIDLTLRKTFVHNLTTSPGVDGQMSLYIPKNPDDNRVYVCPGAASLSAVTTSCAGGYEVSLGSPGVSTELFNGSTYWVVSGLTGTGAVSYKYTAPVNNTGDNNNSNNDSNDDDDDDDDDENDNSSSDDNDNSSSSSNSSSTSYRTTGSSRNLTYNSNSSDSDNYGSNSGSKSGSDNSKSNKNGSNSDSTGSSFKDKNGNSGDSKALKDESTKVASGLFSSVKSITSFNYIWIIIIIIVIIGIFFLVKKLRSKED